MAALSGPSGPVTAGLLVGLGMAVAGWFAIGPDHVVYAIVVQGAFLFMALLSGPALVDVARSRYRVRTCEPRMYTLFGAEALRRLLDVAGWNRVISQMRLAEEGESRRARFLRGTEQSETGHCLGFAATALLVSIAAATTHPKGAGQILLVGVILHAYPVMMQRIVRFRITRHRTTTHGRAQ
ncbi:glycosyl-4,4'-diaponeurosporenoate acyltransferase CrtO family protein [Arthrobacter agilis]|uniref:glycosyl-4,4'-diaponeurosporenoate acyltransferase CrtO family protein n=1 Tax=Arthrobacter agilis TaxID=37921 RepID=UPI00277F388C|nr:hypothetical protein [Arthrobacter agilis]MDQ0734680.1 DMSO reductase anchor subunit [Arthrobacter agilis]